MTDLAHRRIIDNLPAALIATGLTGIATYAALRAVLHPEPLSGSILLMQFPAGTPSVMVIGINVVLELVFAALVSGVAASVRGWERMLICFYGGLIFVAQLGHLVPNEIIAIRYIRLVFSLLSLTAALVLLYRQRPRTVKAID